jgi:hypothetical protein
MRLMPLKSKVLELKRPSRRLDVYRPLISPFSLINTVSCGLHYTWTNKKNSIQAEDQIRYIKVASDEDYEDRKGV